MINFENNMLVLNNVFSKEDVNQINAYTDYVRNEERERLIKVLFEYGTMNYISEQVYADLVEVIKNSGHTKDAS
jgi:hypothetical protein